MDGKEDEQALTPFCDDELREIAQLLGGEGEGEQDLVLSSEVVGEKAKALEKEVLEAEQEVLEECL